MNDYLDFLGGVLFFRSIRDIDKDKWIWMDRELDFLVTTAEGFTAEEIQAMKLEIKLAELLDDRKQWLLDEIGEDLRKTMELPRAA